jgi:hypothetical protein
VQQTKAKRNCRQITLEHECDEKQQVQDDTSHKAEAEDMRTQVQLKRKCELVHQLYRKM